MQNMHKHSVCLASEVTTLLNLHNTTMARPSHTVLLLLLLAVVDGLAPASLMAQQPARRAHVVAAASKVKASKAKAKGGGGGFGGGGGGFGSTATAAKPAAAASFGGSTLRAAAKAHARLCEAGGLNTNVFVRADESSDWLLVGSVAVGEGGSLLQAAHAQKRLIVGHATKISKRLALKQDAPLSVGLKGPYSIMNVQRPSSMPDELDCGFQGEVSQFLSYESAATKTGS